MKALIWFVILFGVAAALAVGAQAHPGEVYIVTDSSLRHLNLNTFIVATVLAVVAVYALVRLIHSFLRAPGQLKHYAQKRQGRKAEHALNEAGLAYFEGRYQKAQQLAEKVLENRHGGNHQALALLIAANSADACGDRLRRDEYLSNMDKFSDKSQLGKHLLLAQSALDQQNYTAARSALESAKTLNPDLTRLVQLQQRYAVDTRDATAILVTTDKLHEAGAISAHEASHERLTAYLAQVAQARDTKALKSAISRIPDTEKTGELVQAIAQRYQELGLFNEAVAWVKRYYPQAHDARLLPIFSESSGYLTDAQQRKNIEEAEAWLNTHPQDPDLLLCLGRMAAQKNLWGKAQTYYEASVALKPSAAAYLLLGRVFDESGNPTAAESSRQKALALVADEAPDA